MMYRPRKPSTKASLGSPAIWLNRRIMETYRPKKKELYYDPSKYDTYLEQLEIK
jgi:hypothetical protein